MSRMAERQLFGRMWYSINWRDLIMKEYHSVSSEQAPQCLSNQMVASHTHTFEPQAQSVRRAPMFSKPTISLPSIKVNAKCTHFNIHDQGATQGKKIILIALTVSVHARLEALEPYVPRVG